VVGVAVAPRFFVVAALEDRLRRKDEVIAEIMEDLVRTKKNIGES
jgi:hypothetical protein